MKSGLEGRNNMDVTYAHGEFIAVSMKSGLEGRNNIPLNFIPWLQQFKSQ